jgi:hypothetical protein
MERNGTRTEEPVKAFAWNTEEAVEQGEFVAEEVGIHGMEDSAPRIFSLPPHYTLAAYSTLHYFWF